jgi:arylsulfatase
VVWALALAACGDEPVTESGRFRSLVGAACGDERLLTQTTAFDELTFDFRRPDSLSAFRLVGADHDLLDDGLHLHPSGNDPLLATIRSDLTYNRVEVEMASSARGRLQVFWARDGEPFVSERVQGVAVEPSSEASRYVVDLEVTPVSPGYRLRVDPIDGPYEVTIRSIRLVRVAHLPERGDETRCGKVTFRGETRAATALWPGADLEATSEVAAGDELFFSGTLSRDNTAATLLEVTARRGGTRLPLWKRRFLPGEEPGWQHVHLPLDVLRPGRWRFVFSVRADRGEGDVALALLASPRIIATAAPRRRPNIVLVSLDTLGAAHLGPDGGGAAAGFLEGLAHRGTHFSDAFSHSSLTHVAHSSMLTGREPVDAGLAGLDGRLLPGASVAEVFRAEGYATAAFTGGILVTERLGFDQGFEVFYQQDTLLAPWSEQTDLGTLTGRLREWLETEGDGRPTFLFLHSYEVHGPFERHEEELELPDGAAASPLAAEPFLNMDHMKGKRGMATEELGAWVQRVERPDGTRPATTFAGLRLSDDDLDVVRGYYHSEITYADRVLADLFEELEADGFLDDAIVVVTADHGEAFGEHGLLQHGLLYGENLHVPLILWAPERVPAGRKVDVQVSSMDIAPTLLELAGLPPAEGMRGRSLVPLLDGADRGDDRAFGAFVPGNGLAWYTEGREKLVIRAALSQENLGLTELFDLATDPGESEDLLRGEATLPAAWASRVRETVVRLPGLHVVLGELDPGEYRLEIDGVPRVLETLYAFGLTRLTGEEPGEDGSSYRCRVRIGPESRLVLVGDEVKSPLALSVSAMGSAQPWRFTVDPAVLGAGDGEVVAEGGEVALPVRVVEGATELGAGLSEEDRQRLEDLGYLQ